MYFIIVLFLQSYTSESQQQVGARCRKLQVSRVGCRYIEGIVPKGPYLPCTSMAGRALLAGYHRYRHSLWVKGFPCWYSEFLWKWKPLNLFKWSRYLKISGCQRKKNGIINSSSHNNPGNLYSAICIDDYSMYKWIPLAKKSQINDFHEIIRSYMPLKDMSSCNTASRTNLFCNPDKSSHKIVLIYRGHFVTPKQTFNFCDQYINQPFKYVSRTRNPIRYWACRCLVILSLP